MLRLQSIAMRDGSTSAWVFCVNHAIDDQRSINIFVQDILSECSDRSGLVHT